MRSINEALLQGNLTRDPISRKLRDDKIIVSFGVATSEKVNTPQGAREYREFHDIAIFNQGLAKIALEFLRKGSAVTLRGKIERGEYVKDGVKIVRTQIAIRGGSHLLSLLDNPQLKAFQDAGLMAPVQEDEIITEEDLASGSFEDFYGMSENQQSDEEIPF